MYPVSFFYFLFASNVRRALKDYYAHLGLEWSNRVYYHHLRMFAVTMVDRFISKVDIDSYTNTYNVSSDVLKVFDSATILVFSHFGGWAASSNASHTKNMVNVVMQESMKDAIQDIEDSLEIKSSIKVIDIDQGPIAVSIAIANALMANEVVAIMGDRASNPNATISLEFLGEEALFNKNPFQIAYKMKKPLVSYFIVWVGLQKYHKVFVEIDMDYDLNIEEAIEKAMKSYIKAYENILREYPNQWLNFYDFWKQ